MNGKAQMLSAQEKYTEADALCKRVVEMLEQGRGKHHSEVVSLPKARSSPSLSVNPSLA